MSDYPKFAWDKVPDMLSELSEKCKENTLRQMQYISLPDPYASSMSFEKFVELMRKRHGAMVIDEPTQPRQRLAASINPVRKSLWEEEFEKWLKGKGL